MKPIKKADQISNLEDLKSYLKENKNIDYLLLVNKFRPINGEHSHNSRSTPLFEHLLDNIPDLWIKVKDWNKEIYLAEKVIDVINHYAKDQDWNTFVKKLGEHIHLHNEKEHKKMWTHALLNFKRVIFSSSTLNEEIKKGIGQKELNDIYLNNIKDCSISFRHEVNSAIRNTSKNDLMKVFKRHVINEDFHSVLYILNSSERNDINKEEILKMEINNSPLETYLRDKREEYTLQITGSTIKKGSHEQIDKIFRQNLMDKDHYYRLNYFNLDKVMNALDIPSIEDMLLEESPKKKVKIK